jgi:hypothetical protein
MFYDEPAHSHLAFVFVIDTCMCTGTVVIFKLCSIRFSNVKAVIGSVGLQLPVGSWRTMGISWFITTFHVEVHFRLVGALSYCVGRTLNCLALHWKGNSEPRTDENT